MLRPFFRVAMLAPGRQLTFRRVAVVHVLFVTALGYAVASEPRMLEIVAYVLLVLGLVEGAALVGWRLTQLPKSQALEFLLTSPLQPRRMFLAEALVGVSRFALVWLGGLPVFVGMLFTGVVEPMDLLVLAGMPFAWGVLAGLCLTAWVYESRTVKAIGQLLSFGGILVYLVVGVMAGENIRLWLEKLPEWLGRFLFDCIIFFHTMNPFGVVRYWFAGDRVDWIAWERLGYLHLFAGAVIVLAGVRAAFRLRGHFHDRHYRPIDSRRQSQSERIGDHPLAWWAVRRVMEYSGRSNLYLAGGFALVYAAYLVAGDDWPAWMGRLVFTLIEKWGGAASVSTALVILAAVPAIFQFGLWDPTVQDRCRRLELLLLTDLKGRDYWHASLAAAWKRGRGYLLAAGVLWLALGVSGRVGWVEVLAATAGGLAVWGLAFAVGFRAFAAGGRVNTFATAAVLGTPLVLIALVRLGADVAANLIPAGLCYMPLGVGLSWAWAAGFTATVGTTVLLTRIGLTRCDTDLRQWYDQNQGRRSVE